jgi:secreted PhoX family phosphatase
MSKARKLVFVLIALAITVVMLPGVSLAQDPQPIVPLTDPMAAFLESRAYAAKMGATAEFRKMEWVAIDPVNKKMYIAMTEITSTMADGKGDINLPENRCGIVYVSDLDANWDTKSMKPLIVGGPYDKDKKTCAADNIANPDSLMVDSKGNLWIGEDTGLHPNNMLWRWDGKTLKRFATTPIGAEVTGFLVTEQGDMFFSTQHPSAMSIYPYNRGVVGAVLGFKATDDFDSMPLPTGDETKMVKLAKGQYQVLARVGEAIPNDIYAQRWGQIDNVAGALQVVCNQPDGNMFLPTNKNGTEGYLYTNYECRPGGVGKMYIRKGDKGWQVLEGENVNFASVKGTWTNCGISGTSWNSVLSAEEYEPPATTDAWQKNVKEMTQYLGKQANPYDYGWLVELTPDPNGDSAGTLIEKRYAMGRFSHEMGAIAPDKKTAYHGDDGTGVVLFKSVADKEGDLSAGTLYAAKVKQNQDGSLDLTWIKLGQSDDDKIAEAIAAVKLPSK